MSTRPDQNRERPSQARPATTEDWAAINVLHREVWWPERSHANWRWLADNPARQEIDAPYGWVVDDAQGVPAAFLGNFIQRYWRGDRRMHTATGFSIIVSPRLRGRSLALLNAFCPQPGVVAASTFNANPKSAPLFRRHGLKPFPDETSRLKLSWPIDPVACAQGRALRWLADRQATGVDFHREWMMNGRLRRASDLKLPVEVVQIGTPRDDGPYADFWRALKAEGRMTADRSPATWRWRLADPDLTRPPLLLGRMQEGRMTAMAAAMLAKGNPIEPPALEILDLVWLEDQDEGARVLVQALLRNARRLGAAKVRMQVVSPRTLAALLPLVGWARREGGWGHGHVRFNADVGDDWSPTPFDADYSYCLRPIPAPTTRRAWGKAMQPPGALSPA